MTFWAPRLLRPKTRAYNPRPPIPFRPRLEILEDRVTPSLTYHGGLVLNSVQAQAVFLGSAWTSGTDPNTEVPLTTVAGQFDSFLNTLVSGPYLNMLGTAGYKGPNTPGGPTISVGAGSSASGVTDSNPSPYAVVPTNLTGYNNSNPFSSPNYDPLTDAQIQADLTSLIGAAKPGTNTLYVVYVEPNVVVDLGNGENSINTFLGYHSSFALNGGSARYAVIPYAGTNSNAQAPWLTSSFDSMTDVTSHEVAEAATDPDGLSYFDRSGNEIGDVVNGSTVYLNGYAVQREGSLPASLSNFLPMTPAGATAGHQVAFGIDTTNGELTVTENGGMTTDVKNPQGETGTVASISPQGIDDFGQPMVDVVFSDGKAYEYHDFLPNNPTAVANPSFFPWTYLSANVKQAVAGQAVSYVLLKNGALGEYVDPNYFTYNYGFGVNPGARNGAIATGVTSIIATHTDPLGVNAVDYTVVVHGKTTTYEWRDVTATASTTITSSPSSSTKHSEVPDANGGFSTAQQGLAVLLVTPAFQAGSFPTAAVTLSPTVFSTTNRSAIPPIVQPPRFTHPDGGGSEELLPGDASTNLTPSDVPTTLADVPVVGPLLLEAGGQLKAVGSMIPPALLPAQLPTHAAAPAGPKETPQSQAPAPNRLKRFAANALLALFGFGFAGLIHEDRRRRGPRRGGERPA